MTIIEKFYAITGKPKEDNLVYGLHNLTVEQRIQIEDWLKENVGFREIGWIRRSTKSIKNSKGQKVLISAKTRLLDPNGDNYLEFSQYRTCYLYRIIYAPASDYFTTQEPSKMGIMLQYALEPMEVQVDELVLETSK